MTERATEIAGMRQILKEMNVVMNVMFDRVLALPEGPERNAKLLTFLKLVEYTSAAVVTVAESLDVDIANVLIADALEVTS